MRPNNNRKLESYHRDNLKIALYIKYRVEY